MSLDPLDPANQNQQLTPTTNTAPATTTTPSAQSTAATTPVVTQPSEQLNNTTEQNQSSSIAPANTSTVSGQMTGLLGANSPYLQQARNDGLKIANRRGLINSSIASGASEAEAIRASLPIAQQDASTGAQLEIQKNQTNFQREQQIRDMESKQGLSRQEAEQQLNNQRANADLDLRNKEILGKQESDLNLRNQTASSNATLRQAAATSVQDSVTKYQTSINEIQANPKFDANTKAKLVAQQSAILQSQISYTNALYGTNLSFSGASAVNIPGTPENLQRTIEQAQSTITNANAELEFLKTYYGSDRGARMGAAQTAIKEANKRLVTARGASF